MHDSYQYREKKHPNSRVSIRVNGSVRSVSWGFIATILITLVLQVPGCNSLPKSDSSGNSLHQSSQPGADQLARSRESELERNLADASSSGDQIPCWADSQSNPRSHTEAASRWTAQRPNGAVLFPKRYSGNGPLIVMEPRSIIAQVGTEVIMVASYIAPGNEYLRIGEKLEWNLDGVGRFLTGNPRNGFLYCDFTSSKKLDDHSMLTVTSNRLWRIHRGTASQADDVSILRGQSWTTVQSYQEGTSSVSVLANNIDNWENRTAGGQIHWIDAAFFYPKSGVAPIGEQQLLSTTIYRRSTDEPRPGWIVRYEIVSGPLAGLGPNFEQTLEIMTNDSGEAQTVLSQQEGAEGNTKLKIQVIRPASGSMERVVVDERVISRTWTGKAPLNLQFAGSQNLEIGKRAAFSMHVTNLTDETLDAIVRVNIPRGMSFAASQPQVTSVQNEVAAWVLRGIPPKGTIPIQFDMDVLASGVYDFDARVERYTGTPIADTTGQVNPVEPISPSGPPPDPFNFGGGNSPPVIRPDSGTSARIVVVQPFPEQVRVGAQFGGVIKALRIGQVNAAGLSMVFPNGVLFVDPQTGNRHTASPSAPLSFTSIAFDTDYPLTFTAQNVGVQQIDIRLIDLQTNSVIAEEHLRVNVIP